MSRPCVCACAIAIHVLSPLAIARHLVCLVSIVLSMSAAHRILFHSVEVKGAVYSVGGEVRSIVSKDRGKTWSNDYSVLIAYNNHSKVTANRLAVVTVPTASSAPITRWLLPFWYEGLPPAGAASVLASDDFGATWQPHGFIHGSPNDGPANSVKLIENSVAPL